MECELLNGGDLSKDPLSGNEGPLLGHRFSKGRPLAFTVVLESPTLNPTVSQSSYCLSIQVFISFTFAADDEKVAAIEKPCPPGYVLLFCNSDL